MIKTTKVLTDFFAGVFLAPIVDFLGSDCEFDVKSTFGPSPGLTSLATFDNVAFSN